MSTIFKNRRRLSQKNKKIYYKSIWPATNEWEDAHYTNENILYCVVNRICKEIYLYALLNSLCIVSMFTKQTSKRNSSYPDDNKFVIFEKAKWFNFINMKTSHPINYHAIIDDKHIFWTRQTLYASEKCITFILIIRYSPTVNAYAVCWPEGGSSSLLSINLILW